MPSIVAALHKTACLGARGKRLSGVGSEHARLLWLVLLSYTSWPGTKPHDPWPSDETLAARTGLTVRQVERAMAALRSAGLVTTRHGKRKGARKDGRLVAMGLDRPVKVLAPRPLAVRLLWDITRSLRDRPAALVTMMVGAYQLASDRAGEGLESWGDLGCTMAAWRRWCGQADNASWTRRVRELVDLGLIRREGRRIEVSPPSVWLTLATAVARASMDERTVVRVDFRPRRSRPSALALELPPAPMLRVRPSESTAARAFEVASARAGTDDWHERGPPGTTAAAGGWLGS